MKIQELNQKPLCANFWHWKITAIFNKDDYRYFDVVVHIDGGMLKIWDRGWRSVGLQSNPDKELAAVIATLMETRRNGFTATA